MIPNNKWSSRHELACFFISHLLSSVFFSSGQITEAQGKITQKGA
jgi:hypothetical protein